MRPSLLPEMLMLHPVRCFWDLPVLTFNSCLSINLIATRSKQKDNKND